MKELMIPSTELFEGARGCDLREEHWISYAFVEYFDNRTDHDSFDCREGFFVQVVDIEKFVAGLTDRALEHDVIVIDFWPRRKQRLHRELPFHTGGSVGALSVGRAQAVTADKSF